MSANEKVIQLIFSVIDEVNNLLPQEQQLEKSMDTVLFGPSGKLDSLGFLNLIVTIEQTIEDAFGVSITLVDERALSLKSSPFETIRMLADYVSDLLENNVKR